MFRVHYFAGTASGAGAGDLVSGGSARYDARKCAMQRTKDGNRFEEE
jgi:hypothetical protein